MDLNRRDLLAQGTALAALAWLSVRLLGPRPVMAGASAFLGDGPLSTLEAALEVLLPDPSRAGDLARAVDAALAEGDPLLGAQLRLALRVLGALGGGFPGGSLARRATTLDAWERSRSATKRQIFQALRRLAVFALYADPASWESVGYDGPLAVEAP